jgi:hypothetical protein
MLACRKLLTRWIVELMLYALIFKVKAELYVEVMIVLFEEVRKMNPCLKVAYKFTGPGLGQDFRG